MSQLTATFRIVTPIFLGGADPTTQAELRVPSIKGALRFWWRALMWGKVNDIAELRRREADLFGSSDVGQSKVLMRLELLGSPAALKAGDVLGQAGTKAAAYSGQIVGDGARYLGYGLMDAFNGKNSQAGRLMRSCLSGPIEFKLHLHFKVDNDKARQRNEVLSAVKLLGLCGGLGSRSRRGYGSMSLISLKQDAEIVWTAPTNPEAWECELRATLGTLPEVSGMPEWTAFNQGQSKALLLPSAQTSPLELLSRMGRDFVFFRSWGRNGKVLNQDSEKNFKGDHDLMKASVSSRTNHPERIAFGLPHNYGKSADLQVEPAEKEFDRRASSLFFHIHQPAADQPPLGVLLFLPSRFLPAGKDMISVGGQSVPLAHGGTGEFWKPVHDFLQRLRAGTGKEKLNNPRLVHL